MLVRRNQCWRNINSLQNEKEFYNIKYILEKDNLKKSYPLIENNFEFIERLKEDGYKLFLLTNITEDSYNYINSIININDIFDGGIYSYQEHLIKPGYEIYNLLINCFVELNLLVDLLVLLILILSL